MLIIVAINTSWNIYNFRLGLIKELQRKGHKVIALAPHDEYVSLLEKEGVECIDIDLNSQGINPIEDLKLILNYKKILKNIKPDVVLSYTIKPNLYLSIAGKYLNIPVIPNISGLGSLFIKKTFSSYIAHLLYRYALKNSFWVFFQNYSDKEVFEKLKLITSDNNSVLPGSGVDTDFFKYERGKNSGKRFLFVGRIIGDKGIREFISASDKLSKEYPSIKFYILGELANNNPTAINKDEFESWFKNPKIKYLGKKDDVREVYKNSDIMVLPSYREGLSKSLIEAAAMKLPIITADVPGCKEVVDDGENGFLCKAKDTEDLYSKMKSMLLLNDEERLKMGEYGRNKIINEFDESIVISNYIERINSIFVNTPNFVSVHSLSKS